MTTTGVTRTCPACSRRWNQVVAGDCPICQGDGILTLGPAILRKYSAEAVARAIEIALELRASFDLRAANVDFVAARQNQTTMVGRLRRSGIIAARTGPVEPVIAPLVTEPAVMEKAVDLAAQIAVDTHCPGDPVAAARRLAMPPITYDPAAVPVDGARPGFSVGGYLCSLSLINDPLQPLAPPPDRTSSDRNSDVLGRAIFHQT